MLDYLIRLHYDPTPAVSNRLYTARYELGPYRASVYKRLRGPRTCLWQFLLQLSSWFAAVGSGIWRAKCGMKKTLFLHLVNPIPSESQLITKFRQERLFGITVAFKQLLTNTLHSRFVEVPVQTACLNAKAQLHCSPDLWHVPPARRRLILYLLYSALLHCQT
jgi:hypothetical protein